MAEKVMVDTSPIYLYRGKGWFRFGVLCFSVYVKNYTLPHLGLLFSQRTGKRGTILGKYYIQFDKDGK